MLVYDRSSKGQIFGETCENEIHRTKYFYILVWNSLPGLETDFGKKLILGVFDLKTQNSHFYSPISLAAVPRLSPKVKFKVKV